MTMEIKKLETFADYDSALRQEGLVCIKFYGTWCNPCKMLSKTIESMDGIDGVHYYEMDVDSDELGVLAEKYNVMSLPTQVLLKNGKEVDRAVGALPKDKVLELIKNNL